MAIEQLIVSIRSIITLYEVWRDLNLERNEKRTLLERLDLLNHVVSQFTQQAEVGSRDCRDRVGSPDQRPSIRDDRIEMRPPPKTDHVLLDPPIHISEI